MLNLNIMKHFEVQIFIELMIFVQPSRLRSEKVLHPSKKFTTQSK